MRFLVHLSFAGPFLLCSPVTAAQVEVVDRIVALVNGDMIALSELDRQVVIQAERLGVPEDPETQAAFRAQVLEGMVDNALILQVAEQRCLRVPDRYFA